MSLTRLLLICGVAAAACYIATDLLAAAFFYPGYDYTAQQVSELSAIGAPSRPFWMLMGYPYAILTLAFAAGVWLAGPRVLLRIVAGVLVVFALNGFVWGFVAPMHMRGTQFTGTDTMHVGFAIGAVVIILAMVVVGALAMGRAFRIYSAVTIVAMMAAGAVVSTQIAAIAANQPTPWMGLVERVSVYGPMIWIAVLALLLSREQASPARTPQLA